MCHLRIWRAACGEENGFWSRPCCGRTGVARTESEHGRVPAYAVPEWMGTVYFAGWRECRRRNRLTLRSRLCGRQSFLLKEPVFAVREKDGTVCQGIFGIQRFRRIAKSHVHDAAALFSELRNPAAGAVFDVRFPAPWKSKKRSGFPASAIQTDPVRLAQPEHRNVLAGIAADGFRYSLHRGAAGLFHTAEAWFGRTAYRSILQTAEKSHS